MSGTIAAAAAPPVRPLFTLEERGGVYVWRGRIEGARPMARVASAPVEAAAYGHDGRPVPRPGPCHLLDRRV